MTFRENDVDRITINGIDIAYELLGRPGAPAVAVTPGGRFAMDAPGIRELGEALVAGGRRVLLWDRPNCGASDISFDGAHESTIQGHALAGLIRALDLGPTALAAGSAGSRVSLIAATQDPSAVSHLILWWVSGGPISLAELGAHYTVEQARVAAWSGMAAVAALPSWFEQIARNPKNRDIILAQDPKAFVETMQRWAYAFRYSDDTPVPGVSREAFATLTMPVLIFRNSENDISHTAATTDWVHDLIPQSELRDPPWEKEEWNARLQDVFAGRPGGLFRNWPLAAPAILALTEG